MSWLRLFSALYFLTLTEPEVIAAANNSHTVYLKGFIVIKV